MYKGLSEGKKGIWGKGGRGWVGDRECGFEGMKERVCKGMRGEERLCVSVCRRLWVRVCF